MPVRAETQKLGKPSRPSLVPSHRRPVRSISEPPQPMPSEPLTSICLGALAIGLQHGSQKVDSYPSHSFYPRCRHEATGEFRHTTQLVWAAPDLFSERFGCPLRHTAAGLGRTNHTNRLYIWSDRMIVQASPISQGHKTRSPRDLALENMSTHRHFTQVRTPNRDLQRPVCLEPF